MANLQDTQMIPITAAIIAHQDDDNFQRTLLSVSWAAEVLVLWTGEKELQNPFQFSQLKIMTQPGKVHDFAAARNLLLKQAQHDWIFFLDSDEYVLPQVAEEIDRLIKETDNAAYFVQRKDIFLNKELHWGEVRQVHLVRLMNKNLAQYRRPVHEVVEVAGTIGRSSIVIFHTAHESIQTFLHKIVKYIQLEADHRAKVGRPRVHFEMICWPVGKFVWNYFLQLGFLDGWRGLIYAIMMSIHSFGVRAQLYEKN